MAIKKLFVLDTNVILQDPQAIFKFKEHEVVLPIYVIEEVDKFKKEMNELGRNARMFSRCLDKLREQAEGKGLQGGLPLPSGGSLRVSVPPNCLFEPTTGSYDSRILQVALQERDTHPDRETIMVSMDVNVRVRADALRLKAENYEIDSRVSEENERYSGVISLTVPKLLVDKLGKRQPVDLMTLDSDPDFIATLHPNICVTLVNDSNLKHTSLGRVYDGQIHPLRIPREGVFGIKPKNTEQSFALDLLLDDKISLVSLIGKAGTGKTLLAVAAGLKNVVSDGKYSRMLLSRPVMSLGKEIGYLPGTLEEKLAPYLQPFYDNLDFVFSKGSYERENTRSYEELLASGQISAESLTFIRGRSLPQQFMIIDEAQNLTRHEVKTIITRAGEGTKIVLTGDSQQIDHPLLDTQSNGLSVVAEKFKNENISGHITLTKGERSLLAEKASDLL